MLFLQSTSGIITRFTRKINLKSSLNSHQLYASYISKYYRGKMSSAAPSANWLALKRTLTTQHGNDSRPMKRRKIQSASNTKSKDSSMKTQGKDLISESLSNTPKVAFSTTESSIVPKKRPKGNPDSKENLRAMIHAPIDGTYRAEPTNFLALDCEMVGVGPFGLESALARVTIVNYVGDIVLDEFVRPQEQVTDWRTPVSGIRKEHMGHAKKFQEIQLQVSTLLQDRYLVAHAAHNDLTALLISHPWRKTRDTQTFKPLKNLVKSQRPALRKLVKAAFDVDIQQGEHNSVIDARATMALYRMYRKQWENPKRAQGSPAPPADALIEAIASPPAPPLGTEPPLDESPFSSHTSSPTVVAPHKKRKSKDESNESGRGSPGLLPKAANKKVPPTLGNVEFQRNLSTMPNQRHGSEKFVNSDMNEDTSPSTVAPQKIQTQASKIKPKKVKGISSGISVVVKRNANRESNRASGGVDKRALDLSHKQGSRKTQTQGEWWKELN